MGGAKAGVVEPEEEEEEELVDDVAVEEGADGVDTAIKICDIYKGLNTGQICDVLKWA